MTSAVRAAADAFVRQHGLAGGILDTAALLRTFENEMLNGLAGRPGSLAMIPTFIPIEREVPADTPVLVMDAGGTNLRVATVVFHKTGKPEVGDFAKYPMPGLSRTYSATEFFDELAERLLPAAGRARHIGFCFSYPAEITPDGDGRLLYWTKEVQAPEVVGQSLGSRLVAALATRGCGGQSVTILNDTVATLLAGKSAGAARRCSSYVGFILGTGTNTAYVEQNARITKRSDLAPGGAQAINVESGNFAGGPQGDLDRALDAATANPGRQTFEKMVSGAYLGGIGWQALQAAAREGCVSAPAAALIKTLPALSTIELDHFVTNPFLKGPLAGPDLTDADREFVWHVFTAIIDRAARLAAINIAAAVLKSGAGTSPLYPVCVNIDGSTVHKTHGFMATMEAQLRALLDARGVACHLTHVDEAPVIGAAVAALMRG